MSHITNDKGFGKLMDRYLNFVFKYFRWILVSYITLMGYFVYQSFQIKIDSNLYSLFPQNLKSMKNIDKMQDYYGGTGNLTISIKVKHPDQMLLSLLPQYIELHQDKYIRDLDKIITENPINLTREHIQVVRDTFDDYVYSMNAFYIAGLEQDIAQHPDQDKKYTKLFLKEYNSIIFPDIRAKYKAFISSPNMENLQLFYNALSDNVNSAELYENTIMETLPANREKTLQNFAEVFAKKLQKQPDVIFVDYVFNQKFVEDNLLYFLDTEDINYIDNELQNRINFERRKSLLSSFIFVDQNDGDIKFTALKDKYIRPRGEGVSRKFIRLQNPAEVFNGTNNGLEKQYYLSDSKDTVLLNIRASKGPSNINYALYLLDMIKKTFKEVKTSSATFGNLEYYASGPYVDREEDAAALSSDISRVTPFAFVLVCLVVAVYFKSFIAIIIVCVPLMSELLFALGFVKITYGYLNIVSSFLVAIMSGMGVNFGTHLLSRYLEAKGRGKNPRDAMQEVFTTILISNITATLTSAAGFFVLALSSFQGFKEFGMIAGIAMMSLLVGIFIAFPSFVFWLERYNLVKIRLRQQKAIESLRGKRFPLYKMWTVLGLSMLVFSLYSLKEVKFNANFASLLRKSNSTYSESGYYGKEVQHILKLMSNTGITPIYVPDIKTYEKLTQFLLTNRFSNSGFRIESLFIYSPDNQEEKRQEMKKLQQTLKSELLNSSNDKDIQNKIDFINRLSRAKGVNINDVPESFKALFKGIKPGYFVLYYSTESIRSIARVENYHKDFELIDQKFSDQGVFLASDIWVFGELIRALQKESWLLFIAVLISLSAILFLDFRSIAGVVGALVPLIIGMIFMIGLCVMFNVELNFFNILMLPAIAGLGIDYGVHILHRLREEGSKNILFVFATTGRAMWVAGIQDMTGFAVLLIALYNGLVTTGALLMLGAVGCLLVGSIFVPGVAQWRADIKEKGYKASLLALEGYLPNFILRWVDNKKEQNKISKTEDK